MLASVCMCVCYKQYLNMHGLNSIRPGQPDTVKLVTGIIFINIIEHSVM